ncbi:hypothetical protein HYH03_011572 [Edaphochlamys debaryana]|uniref:DNA-(apurinic or apyrimidinic site) endonuclease 2 n=1 Tax=Edaphochlamys debaryana TaxID=47281 RepID=A0A836BV02_9CHLO|nr:hypothetical protein HYH03_011572 [Edaphochlamys debaryana]|eukprot:KAG2489940.1 hypothetical protein HYH03_011572 [Edaphochlamys debaryana]
MRVRVVSWNINGLRRIVNAFGSLAKLLDSLDADIICFQETKLTRADLKRELALADGWESFFAFTRGKVGYSGVATFCRRECCVPAWAEEGFTGVLQQPGPPGQGPSQNQSQGQAAPASSSYTPPPSGPAPSPALELFLAAGRRPEELRRLDGEGRVLLLHLGPLALVNVYGPAISSEERAEERAAFKMEFYRALQLRLDALLAGGRRVVVVGDLNISPHPIDVAGATPRDFDGRRADRAWLRGLMARGPPLEPDGPAGLAGLTGPGGQSAGDGQKPGAEEAWAARAESEGERGDEGDEEREEAQAWREEEARAGACGVEASRAACVPFVDAFRAFQPDRVVYSCWNTSSGARVNNYGSRIDHTLAADGSEAGRTAVRAHRRAWAREQGVRQQGQQGRAAGAEGGASAWRPPVPDWVLGADVLPDVEGSDHAPVTLTLDLPEHELTRGPAAAAAPPLPLSSRLLFDASRQATLQDVIARRAATVETVTTASQPPDPACASATANPAAVNAAGVSDCARASAGGGGGGGRLHGVSAGAGGSLRGGGAAGGAARAGSAGPGAAGGQRKLTAFLKPQPKPSQQQQPWVQAPAQSPPPQAPSRNGTSNASRAGGGGGPPRPLAPLASAPLAAATAIWPGATCGFELGRGGDASDPIALDESDAEGEGGSGAATPGGSGQRAGSDGGGGGGDSGAGGGGGGASPSRGGSGGGMGVGSEQVRWDPGEGGGIGGGGAGWARAGSAPAELLGGTWGSQGRGDHAMGETGAGDAGAWAADAQASAPAGPEAGPGPEGAGPGPEGAGPSPEGAEPAADAEEGVAGSDAPSAPQARSQAALAWRQIQQQMKPPTCGHGEPCVIRTVKKKGENNGRQFWCCARPDGLPPNGRCEYFAWARGRAPAAAAGGGGGAGGGGKAAGGGSGGGAGGGGGSVKAALSNMPRKKPRR